MSFSDSQTEDMHSVDKRQNGNIKRVADIETHMSETLKVSLK